MTNTALSQRVLALAGLTQALRQVRTIADNGQADPAVLRTAVESVLRIDADSVADVYGGLANLAPGFALLDGHLRGGSGDQQLPRLALAVMNLERNFNADPAAVRKLQDGLQRVQSMAETRGSDHPEVVAALGTLYSETLSLARPRIMVQGNPHYLAQANVVAEVRAMLLAAVRSALLWRQLGGTQWDLLLRRRAMAQAIHDWSRRA